MFEEGITATEILQSTGKANTFLVAHTLWGISSFVGGVIILLYMKYASNKGVAVFFGINSLVITLYCGLRVLSIWHAYHDFMLFISILLGMLQMGVMALMIYVVRNIKDVETIQTLQKKIEYLESLQTLRNDAPV